MSETHSATVSFSAFPGEVGIPGAEYIHAAGIDTRSPPARLSGRRTGSLRVRRQRAAHFADQPTSNLTRIFCRTAPLHTGCCWRPREGGFFDRQNRRSKHFEWQETYQAGQRHFLGTHTLKTGLDVSHGSYDGRLAFSPVDIVGAADYSLERIQFGAPTHFSVHQTEFAWFAGDQWRPAERLAIDIGLRFDRDSVTDSTHAAPRGGITLALTRDRKTLLKAGGGLFYDRVPLNVAAFPTFPHVPC